MKSVFHGRQRSRGQVLLLGLISLIIIVVGIIILFDVQRIIRGKSKTMAAVDAAALTGAKWQMNSLNLIGELNLVKACTLLMEDPDYGIGKNSTDYMKVELDKDNNVTPESLKRARAEFRKLQSVADTLSQMQLRISFIGPLVGFGAAQQAAKNNGLSSNENCAEFMEMLLKYVSSEDFYTQDDFLKQEYFGYQWREPYLNMLKAVHDNGKGVAVGTNTELIGLPRLYTDPPTKPDFLSYISSRMILDAIMGSDWCLIKVLMDASYSIKWWGNIQVDREKQKVITSSEILDLNIEFLPARAESEYGKASEYQSARSDADAVYENSKPFIEKEKDSSAKPITDAYNNMDPVDGSGGYTGDEDLKFNPLPALTWAVFNSKWASYENQDEWENDYLRGKFKEGCQYASGAVSYFAVNVPLTTLSSKFDFGEKLKFGSRNSFSRKMNQYSDETTAGEKLTQSIACLFFDAVAKPLGVLEKEDGGKLMPQEARLILPVFRNVAMVPVSLEKPSGYPMYDYGWVVYITKFLPALGTVDNIDEAVSKLSSEESSYITQYVKALKRLDDPNFREKGKTWLDAEATGHNEYDEDGNFLRHVTDSLNRDHCNDWSSGGGGGVRRGPGKLH